MLHQDLNNCNTIRIAGVVRESIVDGPGFRFAVFCQGCPHGCPGCHNPATHDFEGGYDCELEKIIAAVDANPLLDGVTFSGGEPFCQPKAFYELGVELKKRNLNLMAYSGYTYEELIALNDEWVNKLLSILDLLVDGRYVQEERDLTLLFRGSKNQRVIDMNLTRDKKEVILAEKYI
ncbi:MAG: anaerobic ribonucleoside-triphosphate reductase activating protein [Firmicutes bacterium]|jgi:anaerobic ribonucleoside-triphosphate reductase activating protein|nr:anaerobic ribonucleoside-triphosphate reductase activating protein [Bacillota bacterium]